MDHVEAAAGRVSAADQLDRWIPSAIAARIYVVAHAQERGVVDVADNDVPLELSGGMRDVVPDGACAVDL
jgi:hypothetical protein